MSETTWKPGRDYSWSEAFEIPTFSWAKPLLPLFNLPPTIVANLPLLKSLHQQIDEELTQGYNWARENHHLGDLWDLDKQVLIQTIRHAFQKLALEVGNEVAKEFELWARRNFVDSKVIDALFSWQLLFTTLSNPRREEKLPLLPANLKDNQPQFLNSLWPCVEEYMGTKLRDNLDKQVESIAPPPTPEHLEEGLDEHPDHLTVLHLVYRESTIATLQCMASKINSQQKQELMAWLVGYGETVWIEVDVERDSYCLTTKTLLSEQPTIRPVQK